MTFRTLVAPLLAAAAMLAPAAAKAQYLDPAEFGPAGKGNYVTIRGQLWRKAPTFDATLLSGLAVEWGAFQSKYVGAGTRVGFERGGENPSNPARIDLPTALYIGGGPQFHIPIGESVVLIPNLNLGMRITNAGLGYAAYAGLAAAYRLDSFYVGAEAETPIFLQGIGPNALFPGLYEAHAIVGFYY